MTPVAYLLRHHAIANHMHSACCRTSSQPETRRGSPTAGELLPWYAKLCIFFPPESLAQTLQPALPTSAPCLCLILLRSSMFISHGPPKHNAIIMHDALYSPVLLTLRPVTRPSSLHALRPPCVLHTTSRPFALTLSPVPIHHTHRHTQKNFKHNSPTTAADCFPRCTPRLLTVSPLHFVFLVPGHFIGFADGSLPSRPASAPPGQGSLAILSLSTKRGPACVVSSVNCFSNNC